MLNNLFKWITEEENTEELLPLCHITKWKYFKTVLDNNKVSNKHSKFPNPDYHEVENDKNYENLVYLNYGMPFYMYEIEDESNERMHFNYAENFPIGIIFKPKLLESVDRFYPIDTEILLKNFSFETEDYKTYEASISDGIELTKTVKRYFDKNENYCVGRFNKVVEASCTEEEKLIQLISDERTHETDYKNRRIEIHSLNDIELSENLKAIILPHWRSNQFKAEIVERIVNKFPKADIKYYTDYVSFNPEAIRANIIQTTLQYYGEDENMKFKYNI